MCLIPHLSAYFPDISEVVPFPLFLSWIQLDKRTIGIINDTLHYILCKARLILRTCNNRLNILFFLNIHSTFPTIHISYSLIAAPVFRVTRILRRKTCLTTCVCAVDIFSRISSTTRNRRPACPNLKTIIRIFSCRKYSFPAGIYAPLLLVSSLTFLQNCR